MIGPVLRRLALAIPVFFIVSALTFVLTALIPGDPGRALLGTQATPEAVDQFNRSLGVDDPLYVQYGRWLSGVFHGDLGQSVFSKQPVTELLAPALPITITLIVSATLIALVGGVLLGVVSARRGGLSGRIVDVMSTLGFAIPSFWLGVLFVLLFSRLLGWFPPSGWVPIAESPTQWAKLAALPILTLAVQGITLIAKQARSGLLEEMDREYVRALRARGIPERSVVYKHALRNAMPNVISIAGLYAVGLLLGTTVVESVFAIQGLGAIAVRATTQRDLPLLQGVGVEFTVIVVVIFCLSDVARSWLNPKIRTQR